MRQPLRLLSRFLFTALALAAALLVAAPASAQTRLVYLWYADGGPPPVNVTCAANPPPFSCDFAPTPLGCKREVQRYLEAWYAPLDVVFTLHRPAGDFDTVVITSDGGWCGVGALNLGRGQLDPMCRNLPTGYAIAFQCGTDAKRCATIIAQEQAHLVGLEHTNSERDVMNVNFFTTHQGFEDAENPVYGPACQRTQNSFAKMQERVGLWTGGPKPGPFSDLNDPDGGVVDDGGADATTSEGGSDDGGGAVPDAEVADVPPLTGDAAMPDVGGDVGPVAPMGDDGCGCSLGGRPARGAAGPLLAGVLLALAVNRRTARRRGLRSGV